MSIRSYSISDTVQVFCRPRTERKVYACLGLLLLTFSPFSFWLLCLSPSAQHNGLYASLIPIILPFQPFIGGCCVYLSGPQEVSVDKERQTYKTTQGWPFFPRVSSGLLREIWGVYVGASQNGDYVVGLSWWGHNNYQTIARFYRHSKAQELAEGLASALSVPQVIPPRYLRPCT